MSKLQLILYNLWVKSGFYISEMVKKVIFFDEVKIESRKIFYWDTLYATHLSRAVFVPHRSWITEYMVHKT